MIKKACLRGLLFFIIFSVPICNFSQTAYKLQGRIIDYVTKEPLKNVNVIIKENKSGTVSNDSGYFSIPVRIPKCTIMVSAIGYGNIARTIDVSKDNKPFTVELEKKADETLDEVVVNTTRERSKVKSVEMNLVQINPEFIKRTPLVLGEADIIKALTLQPGITTAGEGAGGFNVRGGNVDQNLVLVDDAPLFSTSHLLGFFTSITTDAIEDVTLYKGGMTAEYGGRLSSLLNMKVRSGNTDKMRFIAGISPMSTRFFINGPVIKNKLTFIAGLRAAYPDFILNQLADRYAQSRAFFYDGIIKAEYSFNDKTKMSATGYRSYDRFRFDTVTSYNWKSDLFTVNFSSAINSKFSIRINANYSRFISDLNNLPVNYEYKLTSSIQQRQVKAAFLYTLADNNKIEAGADYTVYDISPGDRKPSSPSSNINLFAIEKEQGWEMVGFISDEISFTDKISLQAGLRYADYDYLGPKKVYQYKPGISLSKETISDTVSYSKNKSIQSYSGFEPRASLKIGLTDNMSFKLSYNRGQQFLHLISNTTAISPVDFWKLSDNYIKSQKGDQYAAGFFQNFLKNTYGLSIEGYYRTIKNMVDYKDGAPLLLNPYIESALLNARGRGYGIELSITKNLGNLTGQFNYSYSKSEIQVLNNFPQEQVNKGMFYPSNSDRPHNLAIITKLKLGKGWSFHSNFVFTSGRPATYPDGNYLYNGTLVTNYSKRNMDRLPAYHRLDAAFSYVSKRYPEQKRYSTLNFSFYNIYMHHNAYSIYFQRNPYILLPYRLSVLGTIIPSFSWTLNF